MFPVSAREKAHSPIHLARVARYISVLFQLEQLFLNFELFSLLNKFTQTKCWIFQNIFIGISYCIPVKNDYFIIFLLRQIFIGALAGVINI